MQPLSGAVLAEPAHSGRFQRPLHGRGGRGFCSAKMSKSILFGWCIAFVGALASCTPEMDTAPVLQQEWSLVLDERWGASPSLTYPELWEQKVFFISSPADAPPAYSLVDINTGRLLWSRTDTFLREQVYYNIEPVPVGSVMCVPTGSTVAAIDLRNGDVQHLFTPLRLSDATSDIYGR